MANKEAVTSHHGEGCVDTRKNETPVTNKTKYKAHPAAELFPMLGEDELNALAADIKKHGLSEPIWMFEGQILDGRNRLEACRRAKVAPVFQEWAPTPEQDSPIGFVISRNIMRRHLTASQRAALAVEIEGMYTEEARRRALEGAQRGGHSTAAKRKAAAASFSNPDLPPAPVTPQRGAVITPFAGDSLAAKAAARGEPKASFRSRDQAAKAMGVSSGYVSQAKAIAKEDPKLFEEVRAGRKSIPEAKREIDPGVLERLKAGPGAKKEEPKKPRRKVKPPKKFGKVTSSKVTLKLTITFGSPKVAEDVLALLDNDKRVLDLDHETIN